MLIRFALLLGCALALQADSIMWGMPQVTGDPPPAVTISGDDVQASVSSRLSTGGPDALQDFSVSIPFQVSLAGDYALSLALNLQVLAGICCGEGTADNFFFYSATSSIDGFTPVTLGDGLDIPSGPFFVFQPLTVSGQGTFSLTPGNHILTESFDGDEEFSSRAAFFGSLDASLATPPLAETPEPALQVITAGLLLSLASFRWYRDRRFGTR